MVKALADGVLVMDRGRSVERGPADKVLTRPQYACTERLVAAVPQLDPGWLTGMMADRSSA